MLGNGKSHRKWVRRETYDWPGLAKLMSTHKQGAKDGPCYTIATFSGSRRKKIEAVRIDFAVLDCDTGEPYEQIEAAIKAQDWAAVIASTHSHMTTVTEVKREAFEKSKLSPERYLIEDKGMRPEIVKGAAVFKTLDDTVILEHRPCPKFRIIIPLKTPWKASDYAS